MLTIRVAIRVKPEGQQRLMAQLVRQHREVPQQFPACHWFGAYTDPADPLNVLGYEEWESREAFDAYRTSDYFDQVRSILFPLMDGEPDSGYYESERIGPWWL